MQSIAFTLLLLTFFVKVEVANYIYQSFPILTDEGKWISENLNIHYILSNSSRIFQHLLLTIVIYRYIYTDRRSFIPILINTMILVLYCFSNLFILLVDSFDIQRVIFNYKLITGSIVFLSLIDYGDNVYDRLYSSRLFTNNKYLSRLYSACAFRISEKEAKKESRIV
jgi:hypothetical protein